VWDPCQGFGQPLLADPSAMVLYPMTWLNLLVRPWTYYTLFVASHTFLSCLALFALARRWGVSASGSFVSAALWGASGPFLSMANLWHHFAGAAWIPVVFLAAHGCLGRRGPRKFLLLIAALSGQILAGSADMCAMTVLGIVAYGIVEHRRFGLSVLSACLRLASACLCALALTAALWWPALDMVSRSSRSSLSSNTRTYWSVHPLLLPEFLIPTSWNGLPLRASFRESIRGSREPRVGSLYLGLPAVALAGAAIQSRERRRAAFLLLVAALATVMALGRHTPAYALTVALLPPLKVLRYPVKATVFAAFAWALLAGLGFEVWRRSGAVRDRAWKAFVLAPLIALTLLGVGGVLFARFSADSAWLSVFDPATASALSSLRAHVSQRFGVAACAAAVCAWLALARMRQLRTARVLALAVGLAVTGELLFFHRHVHPLAPLDLYTVRSPLVAALGEVPVPRISAYG
jgi:hypothetical protein